MHSHSIGSWQHPHLFLGRAHRRNERRTWLVAVLTAAMMGAEIIGGYLFGSMALVADGWHMFTHAAALGTAGLGYLLARRYANDPRFSLGTGKFGDLAAFASALVLVMIAILIAVESIARLVNPVTIQYGEATAIAVLGLGVNIVSAWLLRDDGHSHGHSHVGHDEHRHHSHDHHHAGVEHGGRDLNLRAAYIHVLADAMTSVLAIVALCAAWAFGWRWVDPAVGLFGTAIIAFWAYGLMRSCGAVLLDAVPDPDMADAVRKRLERDGDRIADLHLWQVGPGHAAVIISLVSDTPRSPAVYKERLAGISGLSHVTVEVNACSP